MANFSKIIIFLFLILPLVGESFAKISQEDMKEIKKDIDKIVDKKFKEKTSEFISLVKEAQSCKMWCGDSQITCLSNCEKPNKGKKAATGIDVNDSVQCMTKCMKTFLRCRNSCG